MYQSVSFMVSFAAVLTSTTYLLQPLGDNQLVSLAPQLRQSCDFIEWTVGQCLPWKHPLQNSSINMGRKRNGIYHWRTESAFTLLSWWKGIFWVVLIGHTCQWILDLDVMFLYVFKGKTAVSTFFPAFGAGILTCLMIEGWTTWQLYNICQAGKALQFKKKTTGIHFPQSLDQCLASRLLANLQSATFISVYC